VAKHRQPAEIKRRIPRQERAGATVSVILEAAAQVLEAGGLAGFTTNAVADRAGVSIGTLYQYFADKGAVLHALAEREMRLAIAQVAKALRSEDAASMEERARGVVRAIVNAFHGRLRARKAVVQAVLAQGMAIETIGPVAAFIAEAGATTQHGAPALSPEQRFVLSRALMGAIRAAVLEEQPFFRSRAFEDELVRLILAYVAAVSATITPRSSP
jgi:AcrR family transcriptional regulator